MRVIGLAHDLRLTGSHALSWAVAGLWRVIVGRSVDLHQLGEIDLRTEGILYSAKVRAMGIRGHLDAIGEACGHIVHEVISRFAIAVADVPSNRQLRIRVNRRPCPNIAAALTLFIGGNVALLASHKGPNFVALNAAAGKIAESLVLKIGASRSCIDQEFYDAVNGNVSQARGGAERIALANAAEDLRPFLSAQFVHEYIMLARASIVK